MPFTTDSAAPVVASTTTMPNTTWSLVRPKARWPPHMPTAIPIATKDATGQRGKDTKTRHCRSPEARNKAGGVTPGWRQRDIVRTAGMTVSVQDRRVVDCFSGILQLAQQCPSNCSGVYSIARTWSPSKRQRLTRHSSTAEFFLGPHRSWESRSMRRYWENQLPPGINGVCNRHPGA